MITSPWRSQHVFLTRWSRANVQIMFFSRADTRNISKQVPKNAKNGEVTDCHRLQLTPSHQRSCIMCTAALQVGLVWAGLQMLFQCSPINAGKGRSEKTPADITKGLAAVHCSCEASRLLHLLCWTGGAKPRPGWDMLGTRLKIATWSRR